MFMGKLNQALTSWVARFRASINSRNRTTAFVAAILGITVFAFQNCDDVKLKLVLPSQPKVNVTSKGVICAVVPSVQKTFTKVMFLVDKSGSNGQTDPSKKFRTDTIKDFWDLHKDKDNVAWGFVTFNGNQSLAFINDGSDQSAIFSDDKVLFQAALDRMNMDGDNGATPYKTAIQMTRSAITKDMADHPDHNSTYLIVMLTDGVPTDYGSPIDETAILRDVADLVTMARTSFSTVYYGPMDMTASNRLLAMSKAGLGEFLDTNVSGKIPLSKLIGLTTAEPWLIKNFVVNNVNSAACDDGTMDADSDADGLCDKDELRYNEEFTDAGKKSRMGGKLFDPQNRNSFSPYYSDSFYYRFIVFSEAIDSACTDTSDEDHDLLNACEEKFLRNGTPLGPTNNWTNKMGNDSDPFNFDSDGDGFIDSFEFFMTRNKSGSLDYNNISGLHDGFRLDEIFLQHRNWRNPTVAEPYDGKFIFKGVNESGQNCYEYTQTILPRYKTLPVAKEKVSGIDNLAHAEGENVIMISFVQTTEKDPNSPGDLRYNFQKIKQDTDGLNLNLAIENYQNYSVGASSRVPPNGN